MAEVSTGDKLQVEDPAGGGTYVDIAELVNVTIPTLSTEAVDVTHQGSGAIKQYTPGLADYSAVTAEINWVPGSSSDTLIGTIVGGRETRSWKVIVSATSYTFNAFVESFEVSGGLGEKRTASLTLRVTDGTVTQA
ncbi:MAG: hypothetical protein D6782_02940 [Alphaproteobacteria bacterium]|nr:MAG: hypothetical protein D6782_02940 [Alphaproteobacteria bacterium]